MRIHLAFRNLNSEVVAAAEMLFQEKPWTMPAEDQEQIAQEFISEVCRAYGLPGANVEMLPSNLFHGAMSYYPAEAREAEEGEESNEDGLVVTSARIVLRKWSILNLFAAARMHLLNHGREEKDHDPWGWACSLYYTVRPAMFRRLVREGKIRKGLKPADTYSSGTFARMVAAGVATESGNVLVPNFNPALLDEIEANTLDVRTLLPESHRRSYSPSALSSFDDDEDGLDDLLDDEDDLPDAPMDSFEEDDEDEEVSSIPAVAQECVEDEIVPPEQEAVSEDDGLDALSIVALRQKSRGVVSGGYSMTKPVLIAALRAAGVRA